MSVSAKPWSDSRPPARILAIRLQAMGDVVITLPYLQGLKASLPQGTIIDMLTRNETRDIPKCIRLFDHVYEIGGERSFKKQWLYAGLLLPRLLLNRYDIVLDLQNNRLSRFVRKVLMPAAWTGFDRYSPQAAGERNRLTIEAIGLGKNKALTGFELKSVTGVEDLLQKHGWKLGADSILLNPAGAFENRNWPVGYYIAFADLWSRAYPSAQFLVMGLGKIADKAEALKNALGDRLINLVDKTTPAMAFAIIQRMQFVLSEDSGMMHMAWVSGIPTLALFGSTRSDWSRPLGNHTAFLDSSDLVCGNCMRETCLYTGPDKNMCMTRYTPEFVFEKAMGLLNVVTQNRS